ncbi:MAG TPA: hypothetical protein VL242_11105, partial [Sorangium sp.]|nr:hypothetical protein [Sorangium sp.]
MTPLEDLRPEQLVALDLAEEGAPIDLAEEGAAIGVVEEGAAIGVAEEGAAIELADGAAGSERVAAAGVPGRRVRFARGVSELPGDHAVVVLHEDTFMRWRPTPS